MSASLDFWRKELAGAPLTLELATDHPRPAVQGTKRARETIELPAGLREPLAALARAEETSLVAVACAAFAVLLHRHTDQEELLVATRAAGTTVALRLRPTPQPFRALLRQVRDRLRAAEPHAAVAWGDVIDALVPVRDGSHAPLCQVLCAGAGPGPGEAGAAGAPFDLAVLVTGEPAGLSLAIDHDADLFEPATIRRLGGHLGVLLAAIARDPDHDVSTLPMLIEAEREQLLHTWNATRADVPETCVHRLIEWQVARTPDATCVIFEGRALTYREVNARANQLARHLRERGVGPEVLVGVCLERRPELLIALVAVWKAGGAYIPLDAQLPSERLTYMLQDAGAKVLITDDEHRPLFPPEQPTVYIDSGWPAIAGLPDGDLDGTVTPDNLAYVMYTSGSTGKPKGVMVLHRGLVNYLTWAAATYRAGAGDAVPVHSSIAFDLTVTALYTPLLAGGRIEMLREDFGGQNLISAVRRSSGSSLVKITPAHLALVAEQLGPERVYGRTNLFVIGGENLLAESLSIWRDFAPDTRLINEYGPTETVVGCCVHEVKPDDPRTGSVIIGRPIANTQLYVLDRYGNPQPVGVVGELYIGGAGVARGYLNRPDLTAERFVADPFSTASGARLYKTGDMARYRPDGALEYLGRVDNQVKVRGYRIELGEIEAVLADHPGVKACTVLAREDTPGNKQLVAYVVSRSQRPSVDDLKRALATRLPEYMVPAQFVFLDAMPLTTNGKVDRKALPAPSDDTAAPASGVAPRTKTEQKLAAIWAELLGHDRFGVEDNFFELGGHSLQAIKIVSKIREAFEVSLSPQALFDEPTIGGLARLVTELTGETEVILPEVTGAGPMFFGDPPLFGVYHPPKAAQPRDAAVLVCTSIGHEYTRAYRAVQLLCESAARAGFAALRFDYTGVGDSAGDLEHAGVDVWCEDVLRAWDELAARARVREVWVIGCRAGALIAAAALRRAQSRGGAQVRSLGLWDPVRSGGELLETARAFQTQFVRDPFRFTEKVVRGRAAGGDDSLLVGYRYPPALRRQLEQLDLQAPDAWPAVPTWCVRSEPSPAWDAVAQGRAPTDVVTAKGAEGAWTSYARHEKPLRAGPVIARIVEKLAEGGRP